MRAMIRRAGSRIRLRTQRSRLLRGRANAIYQFLELSLRGPARRDEHGIDPGIERSTERAECFPEPALRSVALDGTAERLRSGDSDPSRSSLPGRKNVGNDRARGCAS